MRLESVHDEGVFADLESEWNGVLDASGQSSPFLRHEWLAAWWKAFSTERWTLDVLTYRDDSTRELLGVLPLFNERAVDFPRARTVRFLGDEGVGASGLGVFARPDVEHAVSERFAQYLRETRDEWDILDLRLMTADDPFGTALAAPFARGAVRIVPDVQARPRISLPSNWETYFGQSLSRSMRKNVRRRRNHCAKAGVKFEVVSDPADLPKALEDIARLHEERMQHVVGRGYHPKAQSREFMNLTSERLLDEGRLMLAFMSVQGERVAGDYCIRHGDTLYGIRGGFTDEWGHLGVSTVLFSFIVEQAVRDGITMIDLGLGDQEYKNSWGVTGVRRFSDVRAYSGSVRSQLCYGRHASADLIVRMLQACPPRLRNRIVLLAKKGRAIGNTDVEELVASLFARGTNAGNGAVPSPEAVAERNDILSGEATGEQAETCVGGGE
ncbi:MAG: GNAT family N-acetyltransferase [Coriobacteriales bacterium]|nr:GNAT family N-acetyltransferase [Coriobacteriales bacterium]